MVFVWCSADGTAAGQQQERSWDRGKSAPGSRTRQLLLQLRKAFRYGHLEQPASLQGSLDTNLKPVSEHFIFSFNKPFGNIICLQDLTAEGGEEKKAWRFQC